MTKADALAVVLQGLRDLQDAAYEDGFDYLEEHGDLDMGVDEFNLVGEALGAEIEGIYGDLITLVKTWQV